MNKKISELPDATLPIAAGVKFEAIQGGVNVKVDADDMPGSSAGVQSVTGDGVDNTDPENPVVTGVTRELGRAFSAELLFDKNEIDYEPHNLATDVTFTLPESGHLINQFSTAVMILITDGTRAINFSGFDFIYGIQNGGVPDAGTYQLFFMYRNGVGTAHWAEPSLEEANLTPLAMPANFIATSAGISTINLSWDAVPNVSSYQLDYALTSDGPWFSLATPAAGDTSYPHTGLDSGTFYFYRLRAIGNQTVYGNSIYATANAMTEDAGDITAPVPSFSIANAATGIPINQSLVITFNEAIRNTNATEITNANIAAICTLKQTNSGGSNIPFTATIDASKTVVTITPNVIYGLTQLVYFAINNFEDVNGNEQTTPQTITFTTSDYTLMINNFLDLGQQINSVVTGNDVNFELEFEIQNVVAGTGTFASKYQTSGNQRSFVWAPNGNDVRFKFYNTSAGGGTWVSREIIWAGALTGFTGGKLTLKYFGAVDTNNGLDRATLHIDDVLISSGKSVVSDGGSWPFLLSPGTAPMRFGPPNGEVKSVKVRNNMGATTIVDIPVVRTGTDVSGNSNDGTWL